VSGPAGAAASALSSDNPTTVERILGIMRRPRPTFEAIVKAPRWAGLLLLLFVVYFAVSAALFSTEVGRQGLVDQWENTAIAFGQPVDDARYAEWQALSERPLPYAAAMALASGPAAAVLLAVVLFGWFTGIRRGTASFGQVLAVVATASAILMLRNVVAAPINYVRETVGSPTTLALIFRVMDPSAPAARFLSLIDVFVVWWIVVLAIGIGVLYRQRTRNLLLPFLAVYAVIALVLTGTMAALGGV
jgi:hypothetical protein